MNAKVAMAVLARAEQTCECCGRPTFDSLKDRATIDHMMSRRVPETVGNCWVLRAECHRDRTDNYPTALYWLNRYIVHCKRHHLLEEEEWAKGRIAWLVSKGVTA